MGYLCICCFHVLIAFDLHFDDFGALEAAVQLADKFPAWSDSTSYTAGARVQYSGELYKATADVQSATVPDGDPDHWSKL